MFKEELENMKKQVKEVENEQKSMFLDLLTDYKLTNKRLFIIALIELFIIISMFIGFLIYENQFDTYGEITQEMSDTNYSKQEVSN